MKAHNMIILGCHYDFSENGKVKITMNAYIKECIQFYDIKSKANTPATEDLLDVSKGELLNEERRKRVHSGVAKLLYLSKRVRPEISFAVAFLCTRVLVATDVDEKKLMRVLQYLNKEPEIGITLEIGDPAAVTAFVDASYGNHADGKGHTGLNISLGAGSIHAESSKQKLVSKSSTETELIGLSDSASQVIWTRNFMIHQGYNMGAAEIKQDNKSTIMLAEKGRSTCKRTRHIDIRYFFIKDRINSNEISLEYLPTKDMIADIFTKPLQGALFIKLRNLLLNNYIPVMNYE